MKKFRLFFDIAPVVLLGVWLTWALAGDAPFERESTAMCQDALARRRAILSGEIGVGALIAQQRYVNNFADAAIKGNTIPPMPAIVEMLSSLNMDVERYCGK